MSKKVEQILRKMSLEDKIGQMMVLSFRTWGTEQLEAVTELNEALSDYVKDVHPGGIVLFRENCRDAEQTLRFTSRLQLMNRAGRNMSDLLIATDQEGGSVSRIGFGTTGQGNRSLGDTGNRDNAYQMAKIIGRELGALGINTDLAPVADINNNPANPVIGVRSFGENAAKVSEFTAAFQDGLHSEGIIDVLKHFPGHGDTDTDSHIGLPLIGKTLEELRDNELIPFQSAIQNGADIVMTAHICFPRVDTTKLVSLKTGDTVGIPATMSKRLLTDVLRKELGFDGVIMSDALEMKSISEYYWMDDALTMMINAGVNMLLLPAVRKSMDLNLIEDMRKRIIALVREERIREDAIEELVRRILLLKEKYGLLGDKDYGVSREQIDKAKAVVGCDEHKRIVLAMTANQKAFL